MVKVREKVTAKRLAMELVLVPERKQEQEAAARAGRRH
jgi:hypothetical protein